MRYLSLSAIIVIAILVSGCATPDGLGYAVAYGGAVELKKPPHNGPDSYPWVDPNEVIFWTCGFAELVYSEAPLQEPRKTYFEEPRRRSTYLGMTGEWCALKDYLFEERVRDQQLLEFRTWHGKKYLLSFTPVYRDADGADYIARRGFIEYDELTPLLRTVVQGEDNSGCFYPDDKMLEVLRREKEDLIPVGEAYCFGHGVYLSDLVRSLRRNKSAGKHPGGSR
jgi:hypothetical protein